MRINGQNRDLIDIRAFREAHGLPTTFGVATFEPKDFTGLASIDHAGGQLNQVRQRVLSAIPETIPTQQFSTYADLLTKVFENTLIEVNDQVNLKRVEIDFAVDGFRAVISTLALACVRARLTQSPPPTFTDIYTTWINDSVRISAQVHEFAHYGDTWQVQIINTVYGRAGLVITTDEETVYVTDHALACPAEGFMFSLLKSAADKILSA